MIGQNKHHAKKNRAIYEKNNTQRPEFQELETKKMVIHGILFMKIAHEKMTMMVQK